MARGDARADRGVEEIMTTLSLENRDSTPPAEATEAARPTFTPDVDVLETASDIRIIADLPGVDEKSVEVTLDNDTLTIHGRVAARMPTGYQLACGEYEVGDFWRQFTIGEHVGREGVAATVKDGVLTVTLPKAPHAMSHKIPVAGA